MYFAFFMCSLRWPHSERTIDVLDRLIDWVSPGKSLQVIADVRPDEPQMKPTITGDYRACRSQLARRDIKHLRLGTRDWRPGTGAELYVFLENERPALPVTNQQAVGESPLMLFTLSINLEIWNRQEKTAQVVYSVLEDLFVESNSVYGAGHERQRILSGPFDLIEERVTSRPVRIIDFDFYHAIPAVYRCNYLSDQLVAKIELPQSLCRIEGVTCRSLNSTSDRQALALYFDRYQPAVVSQVREHLHHLVGAD